MEQKEILTKILQELKKQSCGPCTTVTSSPVVTDSGAEMTNIDGSVDITSGSITFTPEQQSSPWGLQITDYALIGGPATITILASNDGVTFTPYKPQSTDVDISDINNRGIFDSIFPYKYMQIEYTANGATGTFSMILNK